MKMTLPYVDVSFLEMCCSSTTIAKIALEKIKYWAVCRKGVQKMAYLSKTLNCLSTLKWQVFSDEASRCSVPICSVREGKKALLTT